MSTYVAGHFFILHTQGGKHITVIMIMPNSHSTLHVYCLKHCANLYRAVAKSSQLVMSTM